MNYLVPLAAIVVAVIFAAAFDPAVHQAIRKDFADFAEFRRMLRRGR